MQENQVKILYKDRILPESLDPYHFERAGDFTHEFQAYNPLCGDKYTLSLKVESHIITDTSFKGIGCALSKASTSILLKNLEGKKVEQAIELIEAFFNAINNETTLDFPDVSFLVQLKDFGGRLDCITLSWKSVIEKLTE